MTSPEYTDRVAEIRARLDAAEQVIDGKRRQDDAVQVLWFHSVDDITFLLSELEAAQARLDKAAELHRQEDYLINTVIAPATRHHGCFTCRSDGPCETARALGLGEEGDGALSWTYAHRLPVYRLRRPGHGRDGRPGRLGCLACPVRPRRLPPVRGADPRPPLARNPQPRRYHRDRLDRGGAGRHPHRRIPLPTGLQRRQTERTRR